jgi:hypothetical protein
MFMMLSVSPGYQLLLITLSVFSNVYDAVSFSRLSIVDYHLGVSSVYDVVYVSVLSVIQTLENTEGVITSN